MKIAIVTKGDLPVPNVKGGGAETLITAILDENEKTDNNITVFSVYDDSALKISKRYSKTKFVFLPQRDRSFLDRMRGRLFKDFPRESPISFSDAKEQIEKGGYDKIIIEHSPWQFPYFVKNFGDKVYLHLHNDWMNEDVAIPYKKRYIEAINKSGGVITVSNYLKHRVLTMDDVDGSRIKVLFNATNLELFSKTSSEEDQLKLRKKFRIKENDVVIVYSGRMCQEKGVLELIKAFECVIKKKSNVKLILVGSVSYGKTTSDDYTEKIKRYLDQYGEFIKATGFVPYEEIGKYYDIADIQVIPSMWDEPFGLVAIEGMTKGLPLVSTDSGGLKEFLEDGRALLVSRDNIVEDIEKELIKLIENDSLRKELSENGKSYMKDHKELDYSEYYNKFLEIITGK